MEIKKISLALLMFSSCLLSSCSQTPKKKDSIVDRKITYEELYHQEAVLHPEVTEAEVFKASYGYECSSTQGYNRFYYMYMVGDQINEMTFVDGKWVGVMSSLNGKYMTSIEGESAVRKFVAPFTGNIKLTANSRLISGNPVALDVLLNNVNIGTWLISDAAGIYQEKTFYINEGDVLLFVNRGNGTISYNPKLDYEVSGDSLLHTTVDGHYGDVHPFYDYKNKKMYMYYLSTGKQTLTEPVKLYSSLASSSSNMFNFVDTPIAANADAKPESNLFYVLGVYEDINGNYRSCFGVGDHAGASVSNDLVTWSNGAEMYFDDQDNFSYLYRCYFGSMAGCGRDPDMYFDAIDEKYYCIALTYKATTSTEGSSGEKHLTVYQANSNGLYSTEGKHIIDFTNRGDPECPQIRRINNRWYIFYSIYGTGTSGNVGKLAYRMGDYDVGLFDVDWDNKVEYFLDGGDLHAAQVVTVADKTYMYGWINYTPYASVWGGYLNLPREVYPDEFGILHSRLDSKATDLLQKGVMYNSQNESFTTMKTMYENSPRSMVTATVNLPNEGEFAGISVEQGGYNPIQIGLHRQSGRLYLRTIKNGVYTEGTSISINETSQTTFNLKVVLDDMFIEAFVDDKYSLTSHVNAQLGGTRNICSYVKGGSINNVLVYRLATLDNIYD